MTGIMCIHAVRVLLPRRVEWVEYCSSYFWVSEYQLAYTSNVKPMKDVKDWPKPQGEGKKNSASVLHADHKAVKAPRASCASVRALFKAPTVVSRSRATIVEKPPVKPMEKLSVKLVQPRPKFKVVRVANP
ncbi:hypothetical protein IFM89_012531 [Coptis chinensis]|uniref:Uncharacterized protein n=1 Tax=Coptis chinensis TaxID=261450 RepID=A0A835HM43_9MAGN|nr:hypothetical protein IFM89_012531 [Coptis chinensis]